MIVAIPTVSIVGLTGVKSFLVTAIDRILDHLSTVAAGVIVFAVSRVPIIVDQVVVILRLLKAKLVTTDLLPVSLLQILLIRDSSLVLKFLISTTFESLPVAPAIVPLLVTLLLKLLLLNSTVRLICLPIAPVLIPISSASLILLPSLLLLTLLLSLLDLLTLDLATTILLLLLLPDLLLLLLLLGLLRLSSIIALL